MASHSPIHAAFARHSDPLGGISRLAVDEVLIALGQKLGRPGAFTQLVGVGPSKTALLAAVTQQCGVPLLNDIKRGKRASGQAQSFGVEHVIYLVWLHVVEAMDAEAAEDAPVVYLAKNLVLSAIAAENPEGGEGMGEATDVKHASGELAC